MVFQNLSNGYCMRGLRVFKHHKGIFYKHVVFPSGTGLFASIFLSVFTAISSHKKMISSPLGDKIKALCFSFRQEYSWDSTSFRTQNHFPWICPSAICYWLFRIPAISNLTLALTIRNCEVQLYFELTKKTNELVYTKFF